MQGVTLVADRLHPTLGMERAAVEWIDSMRTQCDLQVVIAGGDPADLELGVPTQVLGTRLSGPRRMGYIERYRAHQFDPDRIHVLLGTWAANSWFAAGNRLKSVVWEHSFEPGKVATSPQLKILAAVSRRSYRKADAIVAVSAPSKLFLEQRLKLREVEVIANVVRINANRNHYRSSAEFPPKRLLSVGSLTKTKDHALAIRALRLLPEDITLAIAGEGAERNRLEHLARSLDLRNRVDFLGRISSDQVSSEMQSADLLVHPSFGETFGMVFFEAALNQLPVAARDTPVARDFVGRLVPGVTFSGTPAQLAASVASSPRVSQPEWERARRRILEFAGPTSVAERWLGLMQDMGAKNPPQRGFSS